MGRKLTLVRVGTSGCRCGSHDDGTVKSVFVTMPYENGRPRVDDEMLRQVKTLLPRTDMDRIAFGF